MLPKLKVTVLTALAIACFSPTTSASAQDCERVTQYKSLHFFPGVARMKQFETSSEARKVAKSIIQHVPFRDSNELVVCISNDESQVPNAQAWPGRNGERFIAFNSRFMAMVGKQSKSYWSLISIAAHELGHHVGNHYFLKDKALNPHDQELEADYYSGFALGKMGATLEQAVSGMRALPGSAGSSTHPPRDRRVAEIGRGWREARAGQKPTTDSTGSPGAGRALEQFRTRTNRDIYGNDIENFAGISMEMCAEKCRGNDECKAFSFDRWNGWCFLKHSLGTTVLDPRSTLAVKDTEEFPSVSDQQAELVRINDRVFSDEPVEVHDAEDVAQCETICTESLKCTAFSFSDAECRIFNQTEGYYFEMGTTSGFKQQIVN